MGEWAEVAVVVVVYQVVQWKLAALHLQGFLEVPPEEDQQQTRVSSEQACEEVPSLSKVLALLMQVPTSPELRIQVPSELPQELPQAELPQALGLKFFSDLKPASARQEYQKLQRAWRGWAAQVDTYKCTFRGASGTDWNQAFCHNVDICKI